MSVCFYLSSAPKHPTDGSNSRKPSFFFVHVPDIFSREKSGAGLGSVISSSTALSHPSLVWGIVVESRLGRSPRGISGLRRRRLGSRLERRRQVRTHNLSLHPEMKVKSQKLLNLRGSIRRHRGRLKGCLGVECQGFAVYCSVNPSTRVLAISPYRYSVLACIRERPVNKSF